MKAAYYMGQEYLSAQKYEKAIEAFNKAVTLNPKYYAATQKKAKTEE